jgi:Fur family peroxide stress response transcriptional regulator
MEQVKKHFKKRDAILACLRGTDVHPSADWVFAQIKNEYPDISLGTVYRNLALFKQQGVIQSLGTVNGVERFDGNIEPHVHFICQYCDSVMDLPQMEIPESLCSRAAQETGGNVENCQLTFTGTCQSCFLEKIS